MSDDARVFEAERARLRSLGYRMLGSMADADDVVQETWLRWERLGVDGRRLVERPPAWFTTTASRLALDRLKSAQRQREQYVGPWLPEPVITDGDPAESVELAESITLGFLAVLERLGPVERAVFLLADVFAEPFSSIAAVVGRSEEACRQIASRARRRVRADRPGTRPAPAHDDELLRSFLVACSLGDLDEFRKVLTDDVVLVSDGGRDVHAARRPVVGLHRVSRFLRVLATRLPADAVMELHTVNGEPGFVLLHHGWPRFVLALEADGDRVAAIRVIVNPEKLERIRAVPAL